MNWSEYNKNLIKRGNINLWISEDAADWWYKQGQTNRPGAPFIYSDKAIQACLAIRYLFKLPLRATEGFIKSLFTREKITLQSPSYSQLSRRTATLEIPKIIIRPGQTINIAFDSTGLKVFGEGEWKVRSHGASKRRTWRKLHVAIDVDSLAVVAARLTTNSIIDADAASEMITREWDGKIDQILGDGAYSKKKVYQAGRKIGASVIAPPPHNARMQSKNIDPALFARDQAIARIRYLGNNEDARKQWKRESGYYKRSLAETTMYRFKTAFSDKLQHRSFRSQIAEVHIKIAILNTFTNIGIPRNS